jgi:adenylate cyclase
MTLQRRLSAILAADIVGFSRMIRADEEGTLLALRKLRESLIDPKIAHFNGRIVKLMGDGMLVEFASVVDAVSCGVAVQSGMADQAAAPKEQQHFEFRIGINLGDVIIDGDDIHGDGVNVAARLEALAPPGGLCISGAVHDQVRDRLKIDFEPMGDQELKNIDRPVQAWQWTASDADADQPILAKPQPLELPKKPSIAVLAFDNMSGDPEQAYFADGIAEDIITALSRSKDLFVIARNSSFSYRDQSVDLRKVGRELGVRFVLKGSVRRAGNRVRITAQLIEAETGAHVWAEKYDRPIEDFFEVQDEITINVAGAVGSEIRSADIRRVAAEPLEKLQSWERLMKAYWHINKVTSAEVRIGQDICRQEIAAGGATASIYAALTWACAFEVLWNLGDRPPPEIIQEGIEAGRKAIALDAADETARSNLSFLLWISGQLEEAESQARTAIELNPMHIGSHFALASVLTYSGSRHFDEAMEASNFALRLGPRDFNRHLIYVHLAMACFLADKNTEAIKYAQAAIRHYHDFGTAFRMLAAALANDGQIDAAQAAWHNATKYNQIDRAAVNRIFKHASDAEKYISALGLAGGTLE